MTARSEHDMPRTNATFCDFTAENTDRTAFSCHARLWLHFNTGLRLSWPIVGLRIRGAFWLTAFRVQVSCSCETPRAVPTVLVRIYKCNGIGDAKASWHKSLHASLRLKVPSLPRGERGKRHWKCNSNELRAIHCMTNGWFLLTNS